MFRAEPVEGRDAVGIGNDLEGQVACFFREVVFDGDEEALVFVRRVLGDEEASTSHGDDTDGATTLIEWILGAAFIEVANDQDSTSGTLGQVCEKREGLSDLLVMRGVDACSQDRHEGVDDHEDRECLIDGLDQGVEVF